MRWEARTSGKSGYSPACGNEWRKGVCEKPRIKCGDCSNRDLLPRTDAVVFKHLVSDHIVGTYPLLSSETCNFLVLDFDEEDWRADAQAFVQSIRELGVPAALEISRSGNGAHVWIFFDKEVPARDARRLGTAIWLFRRNVTGDFGIATDDFGTVTGHFGDVTEGLAMELKRPNFIRNGCLALTPYTRGSSREISNLLMGR